MSNTLVRMPTTLSMHSAFIFSNFFLGCQRQVKGKRFCFFFFSFNNFHTHTHTHTHTQASVVKATQVELKERNYFLVSFLLLAEESFPNLGTQPELLLFSKPTLPSVGKEAHMHSADKTGLRINGSTLLK